MEITTTKTLAHQTYIVSVNGERVGKVEKITSPHWTGRRWSAKADDFSTPFNCDWQGHGTRTDAINEMVRFVR